MNASAMVREDLVARRVSSGSLFKLAGLADRPEQEICDVCLEESLAITGSRIGYLAFLNEDESVLSMHSWSRSAMAECAIADKPIDYPVATTGLWGEAVRQRRPIVTNDYAAPSPLKKGHPPGHVPLTRHMNVPVLDGGRIVLVAGVGNKPEDYTPEDVDALTLLMQGLWRLLDRNRTREALRIKDLAFDRSLTANAIAAEDGTVTEANDAFLGAWGFSHREDVIGRRFPEFLARPEEAEDIVAAVRREGACERRFTARRRDGSTFVADGLASLLKDDEGRVVGYLSSVLDVSDRVAAEQGLAESELRFRTLSENSLTGIYVMEDGVFTYVNPALAELFGYAPGELVGRSPAEIMHPDDRANMVESIRRRAGGDMAARRYQIRGLKKNGEAIVILILSAGATIGARRLFVGNILDVTESVAAEERRQRSEEALRSSQAALAAMIESTSELVWSVDSTSFGLVTFNAALRDYFARALGVQVVAGMRPRDLFPASEELARRWEALYARVLREGPTVIEHRLATSPTALELRFNLMRRGDEVFGIAVFAKDVTERKGAEAERSKLEEQLRAAQKMEAIGVLAGGVAHDFNNLVSVVLSYAKFAIDQLPEGQVRNDLVEVNRAGERAAALTRQLLAFSRKQVFQLEPLNLNHVCAGLAKMLRRIVGEDVTYVQVLAPDLGRTMADPGQIEQVIMNLVVNARDAMPTGGKVIVETANVDLDEAFAARNPSLKPGRYVQLTVTDTGCGMDEGTRARIFEPFFTTKEKGKGTGLGLSTVYGIVKQTGGEIWVHSEPGKGTTFKICLPRESTPADDAALARPRTPAPRGGTETILVVEDDNALRSAAVRSLRAAGYTVLTAAGADEALAVAARHPGDVQLLLTDVVMPGKDGKTLARELTRARPGLEVVFMSGYTDDAIVNHGVLQAGVHFLAKPITGEDILRKVREVLDVAAAARSPARTP